jgi:hypothetical protein
MPSDEAKTLSKFFKQFQLRDGGLNGAVSQAFQTLDPDSSSMRKLSGVKNKVRSLSEAAKTELFHLAHQKGDIFEGVLTPENLEHVARLDKALDKKHSPNPYGEKTLPLYRVYEQLYTVLPTLSSPDKTRLSGLHDGIKSLKKGDVQSAFLGGVSYANHANVRGEWNNLDYFLDGEAFQDAETWRTCLKSTEARANLFSALSTCGSQERALLLSSKDALSTLESGDEQAYFLKSLREATDKDFFLEGGAIEYAKQFKAFLHTPEARCQLFPALANLSQGNREKLLACRAEIGNRNDQGPFLRVLSQVPENEQNQVMEALESSPKSLSTHSDWSHPTKILIDYSKDESRGQDRDSQSDDKGLENTRAASTAAIQTDTPPLSLKERIKQVSSSPKLTVPPSSSAIHQKNTSSKGRC